MLVPSALVRLRTACVVLLIALTGRPALAQLETVEVRAEGSGATRDQAISSALADAANRVLCRQLGSEPRSVLDQSKAVEFASDAGAIESRSAVEAEETDTRRLGADLIESYEVLSLDTQAGRYAVTVRARVIHYSARNVADARDRMAIAPVQVPSGDHDFYGTVGEQTLAEAIGSHLEQALSDGQRFTILDRAQLPRLLDERELLDSDLAHAVDKAKLRRLQGADFLLIPAVREIRASGPVRNPATGQETSSYDLVLQLRVLVTVTGEVGFSKLYSSRGRTRTDALHELAENAARDLVEQLQVPRVVSLVGTTGSFVIDRGDRAVHIGDRFEIRAGVSSPGSSDADEPHAQVPGPIALARVTTVCPEIAYLRVLSSVPGAVRVGMVARRVGGPTAGPLTTPRDDDSGVELPQDRTTGGGWAP